MKPLPSARELAHEILVRFNLDGESDAYAMCDAITIAIERDRAATRIATLLDAYAAVQGEQLEEPQDDTDRAYELAIGDALRAIASLQGSTPGTPESKEGNHGR